MRTPLQGRRCQRRPRRGRHGRCWVSTPGIFPPRGCGHRLWAQQAPAACAVQAGLPAHVQLWGGVDDVLDVRPLVTAAHAWGTQWSLGWGWPAAPGTPCGCPGAPLSGDPRPGQRGQEGQGRVLLGDRGPGAVPMLTLRISCVTCTSMLRLLRFSRARLPFLEPP